MVFFLLFVFCPPLTLYAETTPEKSVPAAASAPYAAPLLIGAESGLYALAKNGGLETLWTGGSVKKIIRGQNYWALLTGAGIAFSTDCKNWEMRNNGLPVKRIKVYEDGKKSFITIVQEIKDFECYGDMMALAMKDAVYFSRDQGVSWKSMGSPSARTDGVKAVAVAELPETTIFASHSVYGVSYLQPDKRGAVWTEINAGIEKLETTGNPDEVSDIAVAVVHGKTAVFASQTFRRRLYRLDWERGRFDVIWSDKSVFGVVDSLEVNAGSFRFVRDNAIMEADLTSLSNNQPLVFAPRADMLAFIKSLPNIVPWTPNCIFIANAAQKSAGEQVAGLSELWLVNEEYNPRVKAAAGKAGLYLPVNQAVAAAALDKHLALIADRGLNMVVIDMKDDYGRLRFTPNDPSIAAKGRVFNPVDLDAFLADMKERGVYTVARIVAFKDPELAKKDGGKYAVWDRWNNKPWRGYYDRKVKKADANTDADTLILPSNDSDYVIERAYVDEEWVDPYSEEVWEYNTAIAKELQDRGFDEIQFDYIRFPTDGDNVAAARYRWQDSGMDKDSAILSFLRHVRVRITAPISIDIYGANGWYRTGARTGQEVELLAPYVDVICPMYYPSHFEQTFLAQQPAELRPYRIYYIGTGRTAVIARKQALIRPWAQAFYLNVSYDRRYYNEDYVRRQIEGVNSAGAPGYTYWNNSGRYDDIPTFIGAPEPDSF
ncbi:MAG: hypothetical protein LBF60_03640 [Treponema sp.]|jgi:hypothetical protein|nr:hypothetical protein [Treponema sp.]